MSVMTGSDMNSLARPPEWVQDAVFYQVFPDRFARSERVAKPSNLEPWDAPPTVRGYKGGDLLGLSERLDYLTDLGVTALYLNPIFQSASNHRYHTHDYLRIDPMLGGDDALRELLDSAHARGMRVVLDGVFNHASRGFFQFSDILENGNKSAYLDWFHVLRFPLNAYGDSAELGYAAWWNLPALPKFNTNTPAVREFLLGVATKWLAFGCDGWRLDVPNEIDDDAFWREFRRRCRAVDPDCYLVGEIWGEAHRWLAGDQFDAVMNYPFARAVLGFVGRAVDHTEVARSGLDRIPQLDAAGFAAAADDLLTRYPEAITRAQLNLLGSHDTPRVLTMLSGDEAALRLALLLQFTFPGAPCIYYGDEIGLRGGYDPACRGAMPWHHPEAWNLQLHGFVKQLIALRKAHPALRRGRFLRLAADGELYVYAQQSEDEVVVTAINTGEARALELPLAEDVAQLPGLAGEYQALLGEGSIVIVEGRLRAGELPARSGLLWQRARTPRP